MEKFVKYRDTSKNWKMIDRKEFHRLVKHWRKIKETEKLARAIEEDK